jgi:hypothetical protein
MSKRPSIPLAVLNSSPSEVDKLLTTLSWAVEEFMSAENPAPLDERSD